MKRSNEKTGWRFIRWSLAVVFPGLFLLSSFSFAVPPSSGAGEADYKAKCSACHGPDGSGATTMGKMMKVKDLRSAEVQKQTDAQLAEIIAKGKSPMQGYEKSLDKE